MAPPIYVPIVGTNCEARPQNRDSGSQYGASIFTRNTDMQALEMAARMMREYRKFEIWSCSTVHVTRKRRWECGETYLQMDLRIFGPHAEM